jgi:hypothetical protein
MKMQSLAPKGPHQATSIVKRADGAGRRSTRTSSISMEMDKENVNRTVVTGGFPQGHLEAGVLVETIRDPENPSRMAFFALEKR